MIALFLACDGPVDAPAAPPAAPPSLPEAAPPPPDPCRHSVLEQRSPAELSQTMGDADCLARVRLWQESTRLWAASADLDGDEQSEVLVLLADAPETTGDSPACPPQGCSATLIVGDAEAELRLSGPPEMRALRLIDIDTSDSRQELLIHQPQEAADSGHHVHIFTFRESQLSESVLTSDDPDFRALTILGNGRVGVDISDCAHARIRWHRLDGGAVVRSSEEVTLQPGAAEFRQPDGTYRCPD